MSHYLDYACIGRPAPETLTAITNAVHALQQWNQDGTTRTIALFEEVERCRRKIAGFMGVESKNITLVNNTTHGLGIIASSMSINSHENILIPDIEFMSASVVWKQRQKEVGFTIRPVHTKNGIVSINDFEQAIDQQTKAIIVSSVQEVSGYRVDMKQLMELAQAYNAFLLVDGIQEAGILKVNIMDQPVHAYCAGGHKWLGNPFGIGFMYLSTELMDQLSPQYVGYLALREPESGWDDYLQSRKRSPFDDLAVLNEAKKFESGGTPNWLGALGLYQSATFIEQQKISQIEMKVRKLQKYLRQQLIRIGLGEYILGDDRDKFQSAILTFGLPEGIEQEERLLQELLKEQVFVSLRSISGIGGIRVSPYFTNSTVDIERLVDVTEQFLQKDRRSPA
jgi:cysteine desulfurase/selenocysteine lyase